MTVLNGPPSALAQPSTFSLGPACESTRLHRQTVAHTRKQDTERRNQLIRMGLRPSSALRLLVWPSLREQAPAVRDKHTHTREHQFLGTLTHSLTRRETHTHTQRRIGNENESIEWALALAQASACLLGPASKSKSLPSKSLPSQIETRTHKQGNGKGKGKGKAQSPSLWSPPWPRLGLALASPWPRPGLAVRAMCNATT